MKKYLSLLNKYEYALSPKNRCKDHREHLKESDQASQTNKRLQ